MSKDGYEEKSTSFSSNIDNEGSENSSFEEKCENEALVIENQEKDLLLGITGELDAYDYTQGK